ncbi:MAG: hypothetical protein PUF23_06665, partial [Ruminococcus sp.]
MKTLYIHIGTPKTGTTSIQNFCGLNREKLKEQGVLYPIMNYHYERKSVNRNGYFLHGVIKENGTRNKEKEKQVFDSELQYIVDCFKENDTILLSDESIWWATSTRRKGLWKDLKKHSEQHNYQIKVIVYLRRQDQFMMSRYNQKLKTDFVASTQSFDEYFADMNGRFKCVMDYRDRIDNIAKSISKENVIVKRFDRNYFYNGDLNQDFLNILGVKVDDSFQQLKETANTGISVQSGEIKRVLNRLKPITMAENNKLLEILNECENVLPESNTSLMSTDEVKNFMEQFVDSNESIVDEYIGDGKPLFDYTYKETTAWDYNDKNYHEELILFFANAVGSVYKENQQLKKELNKINNQIKNINEKLNKEKSYSRETRYLLKHP